MYVCTCFSMNRFHLFELYPRDLGCQHVLDFSRVSTFVSRWKDVSNVGGKEGSMCCLSILRLILCLMFRLSFVLLARQTPFFMFCRQLPSCIPHDLWVSKFFLSISSGMSCTSCTTFHKFTSWSSKLAIMHSFIRMSRSCCHTLPYVVLFMCSVFLSGNCVDLWCYILSPLSLQPCQIP